MRCNVLLLEADQFSPECLSLLSNSTNVHTVATGPISILNAVRNQDVIITQLRYRIDQEVIQSADKLKYIVTPTTGMDHIDVEFATSRGIKVISLRGEDEFLGTLTATAELTWGLLLAMVRRIPEAHRWVCNGKWDRYSFKGSELQGKTIGIIGYGRLGRIVASYAKSFRMNVLTHDPCTQDVCGGVEWTSFENLLKKSDIISLHVHLDSKTVGLISAREFSLMKRGVMIVNTSRGKIINEKDLVSCLEKGHVAGYAADVVANECSQQYDWMNESLLVNYAKKCSNVILTPHVGGYTYESTEKANLFVINKLLCSLDAGNYYRL